MQARRFLLALTALRDRVYPITSHFDIECLFVAQVDSANVWAFCACRPGRCPPADGWEIADDICLRVMVQDDTAGMWETRYKAAGQARKLQSPKQAQLVVAVATFEAETRICRQPTSYSRTTAGARFGTTCESAWVVAGSCYRRIHSILLARRAVLSADGQGATLISEKEPRRKWLGFPLEMSPGLQHFANCKM